MWGVVTHHRSENGAGIILKSRVLMFVFTVVSQPPDEIGSCFGEDSEVRFLCQPQRYKQQSLNHKNCHLTVFITVSCFLYNGR